MQTSDRISLLALLISAAACVFTGLTYFRIQPEESEKIMVQPLSMKVEAYFDKGTGAPIFWNKYTGEITVKNIGEHRVDISLQVFGGSAKIFIDGKTAEEQNYEIAPIEIDKDKSVTLRLERTVSPTFSQNEALQNLYREHGGELSKYLQSQHEDIFNFRSKVREGLAYNCSASFSEASKQVANSQIPSFGLHVRSDRGFFQTCYLQLE